MNIAKNLTRTLQPKWAQPACSGQRRHSAWVRGGKNITMSFLQERLKKDRQNGESIASFQKIIQVEWKYEPGFKNRAVKGTIKCNTVRNTDFFFGIFLF